jgi:uncharacterized protein YcfJ
MKFTKAVPAMIVLASAGCVAGPGGVNNTANRTISGAGIGALIGGLAGAALGGQAFAGAAAGSVVGGAVGATINPKVFHRDTRGYCYTVDAEGRVIYDYSRRC